MGDAGSSCCGCVSSRHHRRGLGHPSVQGDRGLDDSRPGEEQRGRRPSFPDSAMIATRPKSVFTRETLKNKASNDVIRICMSLRGAKTPRRFFLRDPGERPSPVETVIHPEAKAKEPVSYVLCMQGLDAWNVNSAIEDDSVVFLSKEMVVALKTLLEPWWQPAQLIEADLQKAEESSRTIQSLELKLKKERETREIVAEASRPLVESVVEGKWAHVQLVADPGIFEETEAAGGTRSGKRKAEKTEATTVTERGPKRKTG